jgi:hypothetical protein
VSAASVMYNAGAYAAAASRGLRETAIHRDSLRCRAETWFGILFVIADTLIKILMLGPPPHYLREWRKQGDPLVDEQDRRQPTRT